MHSGDVIVASSSGWGRSARALVRLSGPALEERTRRVVVDMPRSHGSAERATLELAPGRELPCLALRFDGPRSYTGEDTLELLVPGSELVVERVLAALCELRGVREARPGEFSARAYLNGKLRLEQAEGVAALIAARTTEQLAAAERVMSGRSGAQFRDWTERVATLLALVEAGIDFTDQEDVVPIAPASLAQRLSILVNEFDAALGFEAGEEHSEHTPRVVLAGEPNAGKSTLFNALLGRKRAVESPLAGTTRDVLAETLDLRDVSGVGTPEVVLVDLAGLEPDARALRGVDAEAQRLASAEVGRADVVVSCDPSGRFARLASVAENARVIRVRTKADLIVTAHALDQGDAAALAVCALDGWHLGALKRAIADAAWGTGAAKATAAVVPRHRRTLNEARARVHGAAMLVTPHTTSRALPSPELVAGELRLALDALGELTGAISPDEVIGRVFATFCVGK
jgi:tRNA modification GTPase